MRSFCVLPSMELIFIPNCSLLHLYSNGINSLKSLFLKKRRKKVISINIYEYSSY